ncbi:alpha amylase C-terminal domain-containing protein, partial [Streptomyces beihaiensis]
ALWEQDTTPAGFTWVAADAADDNVLAFLRHPATDGAPPLLSVSNFSPVVRHDYRLDLPPTTETTTSTGATTGTGTDIPVWQEVLNTDEARYGGGDVRNPDPIKTTESGIHLTLPPLATVWLSPGA